MEKIETTKAPAAIGPYSQAVRAGDYLFCSGQIPLLPESGEMISGGVAKQTRQMLDNLAQVLAAAGVDFSSVVKTTIYLADLADFNTVNEIYAEYCVSIAPARATVQVAALPKGALVEIDAVAYCGK
jgi:2-iminobutanoate/2-iminopropanoate deaminase